MRILAIPNALALAHVSRLIEIALVLREHGHDVMFAGHGKYLNVAGQAGFGTYALPYISQERMIEAVRSNHLWTLFPEREEQMAIDRELALYKRIRPDLLLLDCRHTARTSAELAGLRTVAVLNAHMSNGRRIPFWSRRRRGEPLPGLAWTETLGTFFENELYDRLVMGGINRIRRRLGLRKLFAYEHEEGDICLLADIPEFNPMRFLPAHVRYIGPLTWHNGLPPPACLDKLDPARPVLYFSLGSDSLEGLTDSLGALAEQGLQIVLATGGAKLDAAWQAPPGVFPEAYVNADALLPRCDLVCCHGGNGTLYQALFHGTPVVAIATHAEQYCGARRIRQLGLGQALTLKALQREGMGKLARAIRETLAPAYRERARKFSEKLQGLRSAERAAFAVESFAQEKAARPFLFTPFMVPGGDCHASL